MKKLTDNITFEKEMISKADQEVLLKYSTGGASVDLATKIINNLIKTQADDGLAWRAEYWNAYEDAEDPQNYFILIVTYKFDNADLDDVPLYLDFAGIKADPEAESGFRFSNANDSAPAFTINYYLNKANLPEGIETAEDIVDGFSNGVHFTVDKQFTELESDPEAYFSFIPDSAGDDDWLYKVNANTFKFSKRQVIANNIPLIAQYTWMIDPD